MRESEQLFTLQTAAGVALRSCRDIGRGLTSLRGDAIEPGRSVVDCDEECLGQQNLLSFLFRTLIPALIMLHS